MSTDAIFDLTAAIVVFGSFLAAVYFREIWKMARGSAVEPAKDCETLPGDYSRPDHEFGSEPADRAKRVAASLGFSRDPGALAKEMRSHPPVVEE